MPSSRDESMKYLQIFKVMEVFFFAEDIDLKNKFKS